MTIHIPPGAYSEEVRASDQLGTDFICGCILSLIFIVAFLGVVNA